MSDLIIGYGEIGKSVDRAVCDMAALHYDTTSSSDKIPKLFVTDVMHICFPYSETFVDDVKGYMKRFNPKHVIIYSTVPIGTCEQIDKAAHSPVEGVHPNLAKSIKTMHRWVSCNNGGELRFFVEYFESKGFECRFFTNTRTTELAKLRSTAKYGINLVWAEYEADLCKKFGVPFDQIMDFDMDYNELYRNLGETDFQRYILCPPNGEIGGHCVVPNAKLLNEQAPSDLLDKIIAMEKK
jgi:hypothetical protein